MGPASVEAVKNGQIGLLYDVPFVLAEVNAGKNTNFKVRNTLNKIDKYNLLEMTICFCCTVRFGPLARG